MRVFESDPECVLVHLEYKQFQRLLVVLAVVVILEVLELLHRCTVLVVAVGVLRILVRQELPKVLGDGDTCVVA